MDKQIINAVCMALEEDVGSGDVTTLSIIPKRQTINGRFLVKANGIIAGLAVAAEVFRQMDDTVIFTPLVAEGDAVRTGDVIATVRGSARAALSMRWWAQMQQSSTRARRPPVYARRTSGRFGWAAL